jgi:predicted metal-dependent enzyme (double-stranded beta helix superfamily)
MEAAMAYTLDQFCADHRAILTSGEPLATALPKVAEKLAVLLRNPEFVAETFNDDTPVGRRTLHHDPVTDVYVLAHVYEGPKKGTPHSHGASWAVYGTARAVTEMTEWRRTNPESDEQAVLELATSYDLKAGETRAYGPDVIHSTAHPQKAWVIRVTGTDLDAIPRYRFRAKTDKIVEKV